MMEIKVPSKKAQKFNPLAVPDGIPIAQKYEVNEHYFNILVEEYGPQMLRITNGHWTRIIDIEEVISGTCELKPILETVEPLILDCTVFDHRQIPPGTVLIDCDQVAFIVILSDPFYLEIRDHKGETSYIQAEVFFDLDDSEIRDTRLILPESWIIDQAEAYQEANKVKEVFKSVEEAEEFLDGEGR